MTYHRWSASWCRPFFLWTVRKAFGTEVLSFRFGGDRIKYRSSRRRSRPQTSARCWSSHACRTLPRCLPTPASLYPWQHSYETLLFARVRKPRQQADHSFPAFDKSHGIWLYSLLRHRFRNSDSCAWTYRGIPHIGPDSTLLKYAILLRSHSSPRLYYITVYAKDKKNTQIFRIFFVYYSPFFLGSCVRASNSS